MSIILLVFLVCLPVGGGESGPSLAAPPLVCNQPGRSVQGGTSGKSLVDGVFTAAQASQGKETFEETCVTCHAPTEFSGALFAFRWNGLTVADLFNLVSTQMPEGDPGSLQPGEYAAIVAYLLRLNGYPAGETALPANADALQQMRLEPALVP